MALSCSPIYTLDFSSKEPFCLEANTPLKPRSGRSASGVKHFPAYQPQRLPCQP